ncbi:hypothetical protein DENSPDRAFT_653205 [Dentipellis sp. KUC8613]|nr:hypothetical protein DENSPDRAFT_653205 [Dentipellis sp. KUC8613]
MKAVEPAGGREDSVPDHATPCLSESSSKSSSALATSPSSGHYQNEGHWLGAGEPTDPHTGHPISLRPSFWDQQVQQNTFSQLPHMLSGPGGHSSAGQGPSAPYVFSSMQDHASLYTPTGSESSMLPDASQPSCSTLISRDSTRSPALPLFYKFYDGPASLGPGRSDDTSPEFQSPSVAEVQGQRQLQQLPGISHILVNSDGHRSHYEHSSSILPPLALDQLQNNTPTPDLEALASCNHSSGETPGSTGYCIPGQVSHTTYNDPPASPLKPEGHGFNLSAPSEDNTCTAHDDHDLSRHPPPPISFVCRYKDLNDLVHRLRRTWKENILQPANRSRTSSDQSEPSVKHSQVATGKCPLTLRCLTHL